jgi:hypothetical protein
MLGLLLIMASALITPNQPAPFNPADYTPAGPSRVITWQTKRLPPPGGLYVSPDDNLVVAAASSQTNEVVTVNYRLLRAADGVVVPGQFTIAPANDRTLKTLTQHLCEGFLLSCSCKAAVATTRGQTFARVFLGAGAFGTSQPSYMLMADYVTTAMAPAHPNGRQLAPVEGPGWLRSVFGTNFGGSSIWRLTVPANTRWRLFSGISTVHTDVTPGNRTLFIDISDTNGSVWDTEANAVVAAGRDTSLSLTAIYFPQPPGLANDFSMVIPPSIVLLAGTQVTASMSFVGAGDSYGVPLFSVEEWIDNV